VEETAVPGENHALKKASFHILLWLTIFFMLRYKNAGQGWISLWWSSPFRNYAPWKLENQQNLSFLDNNFVLPQNISIYYCEAWSPPVQMDTYDSEMRGLIIAILHQSHFSQ
jgi:hypothetical protein